MRLSEGMDTQFFDRQSLCIGRVWEGVCEHQHTFGGPARHDGASLPALGQPAHLLYLFDLGDPRLGLAIRSLRWLPIYYAFGIEYGPFCYRVLADDRIAILGRPFGERPGREALALRKKFPPEFRPRKVQVAVRPYNPRDLIDLSLYAPIFGAGMLSVKEKEELKRLIEEEQPGLIHDFSGGAPPYDSFEALLENLGGGILFPHGHPQQRCPNPSCRKRRGAAEMTFWLQIEPEEDDRGDYNKIYRAIAGGDAGRLRVLICTSCNTICIANPCT